MGLRIGCNLAFHSLSHKFYRTQGAGINALAPEMREVRVWNERREGVGGEREEAKEAT